MNHKEIITTKHSDDDEVKTEKGWTKLQTKYMLHYKIITTQCSATTRGTNDHHQLSTGSSVKTDFKNIDRFIRIVLSQMRFSLRFSSYPAILQKLVF